MKRSLYEEIVQKGISPGKLGIWPLGGGTVAVKSHNNLVLVDPFFSSWSSKEWKRRFPPMIAPQEVRACDLILITHEHEDHCDPATIRPILESNPNVVLAGPSPSIDRLQRNMVFDGLHIKISEVMPGQSFELADLRITVIKTHDPLSKEPVGYLIISTKASILFMGDSLFDEKLLIDFTTQYAPDVFVVALGNNPPRAKYYFSIAEVIEATRIVYPSRVLPIHWDLWTKTYINPKPYIKMTIDNLILLNRGEFLTIPVGQ